MTWRAIVVEPWRLALHYLEEERIVTRSHVREKDKDREARTRLRAEAGRDTRDVGTEFTVVCVLSS
jgi:hypothetical protein